MNYTNTSAFAEKGLLLSTIFMRLMISVSYTHLDVYKRQVEFDYPMVYDENITMKHVLMDFLDYISKYSDVQKMSLSQLLKH